MTVSATRAEDSSTAETTSEVSAWISPISEAIWPAAACDSSASLRTSSATTAKPLPCSPARAASMAALSASRLVCWEMPVMVATMPPIRSDFSERRPMPVPTRPAASASTPIALVASLAASAPSRVTPLASSAASALPRALSAEEPAARAASWTASRVDSTTRTWRSAPWATSPIAEAISPTAWPASADVDAICCEEADTMEATSVTSPTSTLSSVHQLGVALELDADLMRLRVERVRQAHSSTVPAGSSATVEPSSRRSR